MAVPAAGSNLRLREAALYYNGFPETIVLKPTGGIVVNSLYFPTLLVAELSKEVSDRLVSNLRQLGYFVLGAEDASEALEVVKIHSRPIHVMLTEASPHGRNLAATVKPYRPHMEVVFVTSDSRPDFVLDRVRQVIKPPLRVAAAGGQFSL